MIVNQGNKFLLTDQFLFVAQVKSVEEQLVHIMVSDANRYQYEFRYAEL